MCIDVTLKEDMWRVEARRGLKKHKQLLLHEQLVVLDWYPVEIAQAVNFDPLDLTLTSQFRDP